MLKWGYNQKKGLHVTDKLNDKQLQAVDSVLANYQKTKVAYKTVLALDPPKAVVKRHPFGSFDYLPITAVERLLDGLFDGWTVEITSQGTAVNGFFVVVRLKAKIPQTDEYLVADGIGFAEFQTQKGAAPTDFTKLSQAAGVMAVPKARAEAIKNAAKSFGNIFGRNLNRDDNQVDSELELVNVGRKKILNSLEASNEQN